MTKSTNTRGLRWIAPAIAITLSGCPLEPENVGNEQEGGGSGTGGSENSEGNEGAEDPSAEGTSGGEPLNVDCDGYAAIMQFDGVTPSGYGTCDDGFIEFNAGQTCLVPEAPATCESDSVNACTSSAECTERPHGACLDDPSLLNGCGCVYGCETDADCAGGFDGTEVCACTGLVDWPVCIPSGCTDSFGCGPEDPLTGVDALCGLGIKEHACGNVDITTACLTPESECRSSCPEELNCYDVPVVPSCGIVEDEWACDIDLECEDCG